MSFGFLLFPDVEELDFVGPWEVIGMWGKQFGGPGPSLIVSQAGDMVHCAKGLNVKADYGFADCPALDYLLIPGGQGTRTEVENAELLAFVQKQATSCRHLLSVCTGVLILQAAGLLQGRKVTTHWRSLERLRALPGVKVDEQRFIRDGNIWTAAGVSAGTTVILQPSLRSLRRMLVLMPKS